MKCALTLVLSLFLLLSTVVAQQSPTKDVKNPAENAQSSTTPSSISTTSSDDPLAAHAPGIYLLSKGPAGSVRLTKLQSKTPKIEAHVGKAFLTGMVTYGVKKTHGQAVLEGSNAEIATAESTPVFYAYDQPEAGLKLAKFNIKTHRREINIVTSNAYGSTLGEDAKSLLGFRSEQIKPGIVKLTPLKALPVGEYVFHQAGIGVLFFDFGIREGH